MNLDVLSTKFSTNKSRIDALGMRPATCMPSCLHGSWAVMRYDVGHSSHDLMQHLGEGIFFHLSS
jgi:hypothetical protein